MRVSCGCRSIGRISARSPSTPRRRSSWSRRITSWPRPTRCPPRIWPTTSCCIPSTTPSTGSPCRDGRERAPGHDGGCRRAGGSGSGTACRPAVTRPPAPPQGPHVSAGLGRPRVAHRTVVAGGRNHRTGGAVHRDCPRADRQQLAGSPPTPPQPKRKRPDAGGAQRKPATGKAAGKNPRSGSGGPKAGKRGKPRRRP